MNDMMKPNRLVGKRKDFTGHRPDPEHWALSTTTHSPRTLTRTCPNARTAPNWSELKIVSSMKNFTVIIGLRKLRRVLLQWQQAADNKTARLQAAVSVWGVEVIYWYICIVSFIMDYKEGMHNPFVQCPYNMAHEVPKLRLQRHLLKCRKVRSKNLQATSHGLFVEVLWRINYYHQFPFFI